MKCAQCGKVATGVARGWQAHCAELPAEYEDDGLQDVPPVVFFCPDCAQREFGDE